MKKTLLLIPIMLFIAGCGLTTQQNQQIADIAKQITEITSEVQAAVVPLTIELQEQGVVSEDTLAKIVKVSGEIDRVKGQIDTVATAITSDSATDTVTTLQTVNTVTAPFNPYSPVTTVGLGLLSAIVAYIAKKKSGQVITLKENLEIASTAVTQIVKGIQEYKKIATPAEKEALKAEIYRATSGETDVKIAEIKAKL